MLGKAETTVIGYLGGDPKIRELRGGSRVATFNVASKIVWRDAKGDKKEHTEWTHCVAWRGKADLCKHLRKGSPVYIVGDSRTRHWEKDGAPRETTEVIIRELIFLPDAKYVPAESPAPSFSDVPEPGPEEEPGQVQDEDISRYI
jgi:single-strand DNA-binding protein